MSRHQSREIDLVLVARRQRFLIWCILFEVLLNCILPIGGFRILPSGLPASYVLFGLTVMIVHLCVVIGMLMLMSALRRHIIWRILFAVLLVVPLIGLLILLSVNGHATRVLKAANIKVGLMGADIEAVKRRVSMHLCDNCGYDLTGNVSGICPECGVSARPFYCYRCGDNLRGVVAAICPNCSAPIMHSA